MRLTDYLTNQNIKNADFAVRIGVSVQALSRYHRGQRKPEWAVLERIQHETNGAVTPNDFLFDVPTEKISRRARAKRVEAISA